jgi:hypothetical protein
VNYCKICGEQISGKTGLKKHLEKVHPEVSKRKYEAMERLIPDAGMAVWHRRQDLQKAFPEPLNMEKGIGANKNYLEWMKKWGVKEEPEIAEHFKQTEGGN